jgi:serine/threonine protein phosphatase 1
VEGIDEFSDGIRMRKARDQLVAAMGQPMLEWLRSLPSIWRSGNVAVVHAGADPFVTMEKQTPAILHWGHPDFYNRRRNDGVWVLHGHTIVDVPEIENGRKRCFRRTGA